MIPTLLGRLQQWYALHLNGDWEHSFGLQIGTLDNPGWTIKIDLEDTCLQQLAYEQLIDGGTMDWLHISVQAGVFNGAGDPSKLEEILRIFLNELLPRYAATDFCYELYLPVADTGIWRVAYATYVDTNLLRISSIPEPEPNSIRAIRMEDLPQDLSVLSGHPNIYQVGDVVTVTLQESDTGIMLVAAGKV